MNKTTYPNREAFPVVTSNQEGQINEYYEGLTKREYFVAKAMQGILASGISKYILDQNGIKRQCDDAVLWADILIKALNDKP